MSRIAVLGAGAWGTALAISLARRGGHDISLWCHSAELAHQLGESGSNERFLPGCVLPLGVLVTDDIARAIFEAEIILCVTPSQYVRGIFGQIASVLDPDQVIVSATKGLEEGTLLRMSQVIAAMCTNRVVVLSGPSFAAEVAAGTPTAVVAASTTSGVAQRIQREFGSASQALHEH